MVFSGSPRTLFEAFGDNENIGLVDVLEKLYGKENVHSLYKGKAGNFSFRNSNRVFVRFAELRFYIKKNALLLCPLAGSKEKSFDNPEA